jgi:serralysin
MAKITGTAFNDILSGTRADDFIRDGGGGDDYLYGNDGDDRLVVTGGVDHVYGGAGSDTLVLRWQDSTLNVRPSIGVSTTTEISSTYSDSPAHYVVFDGIDRFEFYTGSGMDSPMGGPLADIMDTGAGDDILKGGGGADFLAGRDGNDRLDGGLDADTMYGGPGDDTYIVDDVGDMVREYSGAGIDLVQTNLAAYSLTKHVENLTGTSNSGQTLTGNGGDNTISGGSGNDEFHGGGGADTLIGGSGDDTYFIENAQQTVVENAGSGIDAVMTALGSYTLPADVENLTGTAMGPQSLAGNELDNVIRTGNGGDGVARVTGGAGNDTLIGGLGADTLDGSAGADTMIGGRGDDVFFIDNVGDFVTENSGEGTDFVYTQLASYTLADNVEKALDSAPQGASLTGNSLDNYLQGGDAGDAINGGAGDDRLVGGEGRDTLDGGAGADTLIGGSGWDIYIVDAFDSVIEAQNQGFDEVRTGLSSYTLTANVENLTGTSYGGQTLTGNDLKNTIKGGDGDDTLNGGGGNDTLLGSHGDDTMAGGAGNDVYGVDTLGDVAIENAGEGTDRVETGLTSYTLGATLEDLKGTGADQSLIGNELGNAIRGGQGQDQVTGEAGADHFVFLAGDSSADHALSDVIMDFDSASGDLIDVSGIDAKMSQSLDQDFTFIGANAFSGTAGELHYVQEGGNTFVEGDVNGDAQADFAIQLTGLHTLDAGDFAL